MAEFYRLKRAKKLLSHFGVMALDLIFPVECFGCGAEGKWICDQCLKGLPYKENQYCLECKKPNRFGEFCPECQKNYYLDGVLIAGDYEYELLSRAIKNIKYRLIKAAAEDLGKYLAAFLVNEINKLKVDSLDLKKGKIWEKLEDAKEAPGIFLNLRQAIIIPVPLFFRRERSRGFNQAEVIAETVSRQLSVSIEKRLLIRHKPTAPQAKLGEEDRRKNVIGCFKWIGQSLNGTGVILIDDVATTGSTLNECAKVLKENGAGEVFGLVVAKG